MSIFQSIDRMSQILVIQAAGEYTFVFTICLRSSGMCLRSEDYVLVRHIASGVLTNESSHTPQLCS